MTTPHSAAPGPSLGLRAVSVRLEGATWNVTWSVVNEGLGAVRLLATWAPHGRFRCAEQAVTAPPLLEVGESFCLALDITANEAPGTEVENAFLILRVESDGRQWRVFARLRVAFEEGNSMIVRTEAVTTQPVGFSRRA